MTNWEHVAVAINCRDHVVKSHKGERKGKLSFYSRSKRDHLNTHVQIQTLLSSMQSLGVRFGRISMMSWSKTLLADLRLI